MVDWLWCGIVERWPCHCPSVDALVDHSKIQVAHSSKKDASTWPIQSRFQPSLASFADPLLPLAQHFVVLEVKAALALLSCLLIDPVYSSRYEAVEYGELRAVLSPGVPVLEVRVVG